MEVIGPGRQDLVRSEPINPVFRSAYLILWRRSFPPSASLHSGTVIDKHRGSSEHNTSVTVRNVSRAITSVSQVLRPCSQNRSVKINVTDPALTFDTCASAGWRR